VTASAGSERAHRTARVLLAAALAGLAALLVALEPPWQVPGGPAFLARDGEPLVPIVKRALWWSALASALLCAALLATARRWTAPLPGARPPAPPAPRWLAPGLLAALLLGALVRGPLATSGLWWDEAWVVRRAAVGEFEPGPSLDGPVPRFERVPWVRTVFAWEKPTNHLPQSAAARVSLGVWRAAAGADPWAFDELALRLPSLLAALASIPLLGLLVAEWGFPRAGVASALLLALHPWHVEDATAARGYAFVAFGAVAGALCLARALRTAAWRWWLAYAATQVLLLWTHPFAVYLSACFGAAALVHILLAHRPREALRLVAVNAAAAAAFAVLMGPAFAQVPLWHAVHTTAEGDTRSRWSLAGKVGRELWMRAAVGLPASVPQTDPERTYYDFRGLRKRTAAARPLAFAALPALALVGLGALLRGAGPARPVVAALALAPVAALVGSALLDQLGRRFHARFLFFALALVPPVLAVGVDALAARLGGRRRGGLAAALALAVAVAGFAWAVLPALRSYAEHPFSGMRDAAAFVASSPDAAGALRAGVGLGGDTVRVYDPGVLHVETGDDLRGLCERARAEGRPLYVLYGYQGRNRLRHEDVFARLDDPRLFEPLGRFDAIAPEFVYRVLRYTGAPLGAAP
jgi:hypothetical protein